MLFLCKEKERLCQVFVGTFFGFRSSVEKLCVSWALPFVECPRVTKFFYGITGIQKNWLQTFVTAPSLQTQFFILFPDFYLFNLTPFTKSSDSVLLDSKCSNFNIIPFFRKLFQNKFALS